jgi:NitT/TauT family transport system ATP-binding protein
MRQRVALARALAADPDIILADESFSHLDEVTGERLRDAFRAVAKETGKTVLHITHSIDEALALADRIIVLRRPGQVSAIINLRDEQSGRDTLRAAILRHLQEDALLPAIMDAAD